MTATTYRVESNSLASGGQMLSLYQSSGTTGSASTTFNGTSGTYDVVVAYFDENDGVTPYSLAVGANQFSWSANQNLGSAGVSSQNLVRRSVFSGVSVNAGDTINLTGAANQAEWARVDYIEFVPVTNSSPSTINGTNNADTLNGNVQDNIINGLGGNDTINGGDGNDTLDGGAGNNILNGGNGTDTVSYASSIGGVVANLDTGLVTRDFATSSTTALKIMPLGDSNTRGKEPNVNSPYRAGYRDDLWASFKDGSFNINFVGNAAQEGPSTVTGQNGTYTFDKNHQGHGGFAIKGAGAQGEILPNVNSWLNAANPDVVMLMAGTNDFIYQNTTASATILELEELIDTIYAWSPNVNLFVSTIAPFSTTRSYFQEGANYNNLISDLVGQSKYQDKNLTLVDTRDILGQGDLWDGIHLTNEGYTKQANAWYDAILEKGNGKDTLSNIENLVGSGYDDELTGNLGVNVINGGAGNDLIRSGGSNDQLTGGSGNDTFALANGEGTDTITDFVVGQDLLGLSGGLTFDQLSIIQGTAANANDTLIKLGDEQLAILSGLQAGTITANSFTVV
jgi:Ca2+-binding RTX toxin-like protein